MPQTEFHRRMLERAIRSCGSRELLCRRLRVPSSALDDWLRGKERVPRPVFLMVVDILLEEPES
jgi:hypothetical protein